MIAVALFAAGAAAQAPAPSDAAKAMVGAWEISNAARDKTCPVTFSSSLRAGGFKLELDRVCGTAFPALKDVVVWAMGPNDAVRLLDSKGAVILDFIEVESGICTKPSAKARGCFSCAPRPPSRPPRLRPEQLFGEWTLLQEFEKPLCRLTLSNASAGGESYKITVEAGLRCSDR